MNRSNVRFVSQSSVIDNRTQGNRLIADLSTGTETGEPNRDAFLFEQVDTFRCPHGARMESNVGGHDEKRAKEFSGDYAILTSAP